MLYRNRFSILAALVAGVAFTTLTARAPAAELRFNSSAYVNGVSRLNGKDSNSYQLIGGTFGNDVSKVTVRGTSLANATTTLIYTATPENEKQIEFKTNAFPDNKASSATAQIHTAPRRNEGIGDVLVTVAPSFREKPGRPVNVSITVFYLSEVAKKDSSTYNWCKVYVNGERMLDKRLISKATGSETFNFKATIGKSFKIRLMAMSHTTKANRAAQTLRVTMRVK